MRIIARPWRIVRGAALLAATGFAFSTSPAAAQPPIKLIVAYAPGGGVDAAARLVARSMQQALQQPVVVDNRPGAGSIIAAKALMSAPPDGLTLFMADSALLLSPYLYDNVKFSMQSSFATIGMVGKVPLAIVGSADFPAATPAQLLAQAKSANALSYGTPGVGTLQHLSGELLKSSAHANLTHVPYRGGAQVINALLSNDIPLGIVSLTSALPQLGAGKLKLIAVMSEKRLKSLPATPAMAETLPGFSATPTLFMLAPSGIPPATVTRLNQALRAALADNAIAGPLDAQGIVPEASTPAELSGWMRAEEARWAEVVRNGKISGNQ